MRAAAVLVLLGLARVAGAQGLLINEVLPSPNEELGFPEAIELYNPTAHAIDLRGHRLVIQDAWQEVEVHALVPAHGHCVLWGEEDSLLALEVRTPRRGGSLLLIAPDGRTVQDVFSWPALPHGMSIARLSDGGREWGYFDGPTLGTTNNGASAYRRLLSPPTLVRTKDQWTVEAEAGTEVFYTLDGSVPDEGSRRYDGPLTAVPGSIITARAFAPNARPSDPASSTRPEQADDRAIALRIDPTEWTVESGLFAANGRANYARRGKAWQRMAYVEMIDGNAGTGRPVALAVSGSGTRSREKKNLKLTARGRVGNDDPIQVHGLSPYHEVLLRADASPHAFLRGLFMEQVVHAAGDRVDVQPSVPLPLYINGRYAGLYRAMPAKGPEWLRALSGGAAVDAVEGPAARAICGSRDGYAELQHLLMEAPVVDSLAQHADLESLIELACLDLYMGRADHELNMRAWRAADPGGRWRWVLYDVDLWSPPDENSVARMCSADLSEAPYLPQLLGEAELRERTLARMSALLATVLSPANATMHVQALFAEHQHAMQADHDRWGLELEAPSPESSLDALTTHIARRPAALLEQLSERTHHDLVPLQVEVVPADAGVVFVEDLPLAGKARFQRFADVPLDLRAVAAEGMEFVGWKGVEESGTTLVLRDARGHRLQAVFRKKGSGHNGL